MSLSFKDAVTQRQKRKYDVTHATYGTVRVYVSHIGFMMPTVLLLELLIDKNSSTYMKSISIHVTFSHNCKAVIRFFRQCRITLPVYLHKDLCLFHLISPLYLGIIDLIIN